ncbi:uncharacterized protein LOC108001177 [Apis cerana]|uniref:Dehydrogenase/reductase SDR family member n=1 Tax=Apis cerana cerana TaxID=94128 RepID=A0A2A3E605_APICC|nr:uncharacterized protein LOC108001177 [Apis cerana]PBC26712.1 Dehydrogenase/reductase SDR family member [Apis cerana cerana]
MLRSSINRSMQQINRNLSEIKCKRLEGKVAIVTASTQGIGFAIAKRLAEEGAKVMISSRKEENVQNALKELKSKNLNVCGMTCHVGKNEDRKSLLEKTIQEFHGLDILVLNAGVNPSFSTFFETSESVWDKIFDINVKSTFLLLRDSLSFLRKSKSASVILLSSIVGYLPLDMLGVYSISKTSILGINQIAANILAPEGIRVNCIAPGVIKTKFSQILYENETGEMMLSKIPMNKFGKSDNIASVAAFLASDDASYITGETIVAAGGMRSRL